MRVTSSGNLTVELIRAQRFDVYHHALAQDDPAQTTRGTHTKADHCNHCAVVDRVELSCGSLASDPWAHSPQTAPSPIDRPPPVGHVTGQPTLEPEPEPADITPVVGSPALAGLGVALIVPGTLLDVVA